MSAGHTAVERVIPMLLFCPKCGLQHVDEPDERSGWNNPPHRSHLCHGCGCIWRPADVPTTGVVAIETSGSADNWGESNSAAIARTPAGEIGDAYNEAGIEAMRARIEQLTDRTRQLEEALDIPGIRQLEDDVRFYSGNEGSGLTEIMRQKAKAWDRIVAALNGGGQ